MAEINLAVSSAREHDRLASRNRTETMIAPFNMNSQLLPFLPFPSSAFNGYNADEGPRLTLESMQNGLPVDFAASGDRGENLAKLRDMMSTFIRRYQRINKLREKILLHRSQTKHQWASSRDYLRFVTSSQNAFVEAAAAVPVNSSGDADNMKRLYLQVLQDHQKQNELAKKTEKMETELASLEFDMQQMEDSLAVNADTMLHLLFELTGSLGGLKSQTAESESIVSSAAPTTTDVPHIVQYYFDKAGDVNVARERLADLEMEVADARSYRQLQRDQEAQLDMSDADFDGIYTHRRNGAVEAVIEAMKVANLAKKICLNENLDPDSFMPARLDESTEAESSGKERENRPSTPSSRGLKISETIRTTDALSATSLSSRSFPRNSGKPPPLDDRVQRWMSELNSDSPSSPVHKSEPAKRTCHFNSLETIPASNIDWCIMPVPTKVYVRGIDNLEVSDIEHWAVEYQPSELLGMEWIDSTSINLVYATELAATEALHSLSAFNITDPLQLRPAKKFSTHPEIDPQVRQATVLDGMATQTQDPLQRHRYRAEERGRRATRPRKGSANRVRLTSVASEPSMSDSIDQLIGNGDFLQHRRESSLQS